MPVPTTPVPPPAGLKARVTLAPRTTLAVGGEAEFLIEAQHEAQLMHALRWAQAGNMPVTVLGGGSNVLVPDCGVAGLVVQPSLRGFAVSRVGRTVQIRVGAGETWDRVVASAVRAGWQGIECLSAIPGWAGAAPVQNIGAYGQEVAETIVSVEAVHRRTLQPRRFIASECGFGYRDSRFKRCAEWIITALTLRLTAGAPPAVRYPGLAAELPVAPTLAEVREAVIRVRRTKGMVPAAFGTPGDADLRSAGSWFTNPIVDSVTAAAVAERAAEVAPGEALPHWPAGPDRVKLSAGWLIERAGLQRGAGDGAVGLSTRHCLALVNRGNATASELLAFEQHVRKRVAEVFGVTLQREPVCLGSAAAA